MENNNKNNHSPDHNETSSEMGGKKGLPVMSCDVEDRRPREWENKSHKSFVKPVGGGTTFTIGEFMTGEEAQALIKRRPGSECKMREMSGNHIFEKDCAAGFDKSGCYPPENLWVCSGRLQVPKPASSRATIYLRLSPIPITLPHRHPCALMSLTRCPSRPTSYIDTQGSCRVNSGLEGQCASIQRRQKRSLRGQSRRCYMGVWM